MHVHSQPTSTATARASTVFDPLGLEGAGRWQDPGDRRFRRPVESDALEALADARETPSVASVDTPDPGLGEFLMAYPDELIDEIRRLSHDVLDEGAEGGRRRALQSLMEEASEVLTDEPRVSFALPAFVSSALATWSAAWWGLDDVFDSPQMGSLLRGWLTGTALAVCFVSAIGIANLFM